ncbi:MAG: UDP-glucose 4-epimerase GalE [Gammaproteobacteria bacterium]|nr:MAG: UDP-glucose 4-epimerase GalE [Gammaproteobacteria bacterium]
MPTSPGTLHARILHRFHHFGSIVIRILVTGGAGYIGSHTVVELLAAGHSVAIVDSLVNAHPAVLPRLAELGGKVPDFHQLDIRDRAALGAVLDAGFDAVIHFAGRKAVGESITDPLGYWDTNVVGTLVLLEEMRRTGVRTLVFSSSATVYGNDAVAPFDESLPTAPINPYGETKLAVERMLEALARAEPEWHISSLRYFNPVGAHPSGNIGEDPNGIPDNLMPYITQVAVGRRDKLRVFGDDYDTPDGTGVRDYIHVVDLALGHMAALEYLAQNSGYWVHNLGTGRGHSVLEVIQAFEKASGRPVPYDITARREGDAAAAWADTQRAEAELAWRAERDIDAMCRDAWNWQRRNPNGFGNEP